MSIKFCQAGGIPAVMSRLKSKLNLDVMTVTGRTMDEEIAEFCPINPKAYDEVIASLESPVHTKGGIAILHGSLAPEGSVVKQIAVSRSMLVHKGPAVVFNSEEESMTGIVNGKIKAGDVVVISWRLCTQSRFRSQSLKFAPESS
jgi:dihydroxy-acid dehydratase